MDERTRALYDASDALSIDIWKDPSVPRVRALIDPGSEAADIRILTLNRVLSILLHVNEPAFQPIYAFLGLAHEDDRQTPYRIMRQLYKNFASTEELVARVCAQFSIELELLVAPPSVSPSLRQQRENRSAVFLPAIRVRGLLVLTPQERVEQVLSHRHDNLLSWLRQHAIPLKTVEAGCGFDDLQPLKPVIGSARIVALGEATHGTREFFQLKHRLLEFLVTEMDFTTFRNRG